MSDVQVTISQTPAKAGSPQQIPDQIDRDDVAVVLAGGKRVPVEHLQMASWLVRKVGSVEAARAALEYLAIEKSQKPKPKTHKRKQQKK